MIKKIIIFLFLLVSFIEGYSQGFPYKQPYGNKQTLVYSKGLQGADSAFVFIGSYADTTAANNGGTDIFAGAVIRTSDDNLWLRNNAHNAWVLVGGGVDSVNSISVPNVANLRAVNYQFFSAKKKNSNDKPLVTVQGYYAPMDIAGIRQYWWDDTCTHADNDGSYILPTGHVGAGRWRLLYDPSKPINVAWFGFVADGTTDNYPAFVKLKAWLVEQRTKWDPNNPSYTYFARLPTMIFPSAFNYYKFNRTLNFEYPITILGGSVGSPFTTKLLFPSDSVGIALWWVDQFSSGTSSANNLIKDISLYALGDGTRDTTAHGIKVRAPSYFENVDVENFGGNGFDLNSTDPLGSNLDFCYLKNCKAYYNWNGLFIKGGEANVIDVSESDFSINHKWGVYDIGFLGNIYYRCHASSNAVTTEGQKTYVIHRTGGTGIRYQYAAKYDGFLRMPGDSTGWENDWVLVGDSTQWHNGYAPDYVAGTYYWVGGSYYLETGSLIFCYDEAGSEMGRYLGLYAQDINGGTHGAGFQWNSIGSYQDTYSGQLIMQKGGYVVGDIAGNKFSRQNKYNVDVIRGTDGIRLTYDTTYNVGSLQEMATGNSWTKLSTGSTSAATFGRSDLTAGVILNLAGVHVGSTGGLNERKIMFGTATPGSGTWSAGDLVIKENPAVNGSYGWRCTVGGTPGTWDTIWLVPSSGTTGQVLTKNSNTSGDFSWATSSGGGSITGGGTAGQATYWSGATSITGNAGYLADPTSATPYKFSTSSSSPLGGTYFQAAKFLTPNSANGNITQFMLGRDESSNNLATLQYNYVSTGSSSNSLGINFYGSELFNFNAAGEFSIGGNVGGEKLYVNGNAHIGGRTALSSLYVGGLANPDGTSIADFTSTTKGLLVPRQTYAQRDAIGSPANGLLIYNTQTNKFNWYNGSTWKVVYDSSGVESTYSPTLTNTTNVGASTPYTTYYKRTGDMVVVWGTVDIDATAATTISEMGFSLPIASAIANVYDIAGTASFEDNTCVQIIGDVTNDRAKFRFTPQSATNNKYSFHFSYKVL